jgi:hypothetical protein
MPFLVPTTGSPQAQKIKENQPYGPNPASEKATQEAVSEKTLVLGSS